MRYILLPFLCFIVLACQDLKKDGQIAEIESLEQKRDSISRVFEEKNAVDSIAEIELKVKSVEHLISLHYESDTLNLELGKKLNEYKMIRKQLPAVLQSTMELQKRLADEEKALHNLKIDIENGAGDKSKYDESIALERGKTEGLEKQLNEILLTREQSFDAYKRLHLEMEAFSKSLHEEK